MDLRPMQLKVSVFLLILAVGTIAYLAYKVYTNKRWIRVNAIIGFATIYLAAPAFKFVIKAYGINVDAAWNEEAGAKDAVAALVIIALLWLEILFMKNEAALGKAESHHKYLHEFKTVVADSLQNGVSDDVIARNLGIPIDKVQAILMCAAMAGKWSKNSVNGDGDCD
jgi:hypothetical protein